MTDFSAVAAWMRGQVMPIEQAHIGVLDWGLTHSDVTYDVVPDGGAVFSGLRIISIVSWPRWRICA